MDLAAVGAASLGEREERSQVDGMHRSGGGGSGSGSGSMNRQDFDYASRIMGAGRAGDDF